jgi:hypothetical protein
MRVALAFALALASTDQSMINLQVGARRSIEQNNGPHKVDVVVALAQPAAAQTVVDYTTRDRIATAGLDYVANKGTLTFAKGEFVKRITVTIIGELLVEPDETFDIVLGDSTPNNPLCPSAAVSAVNLTGCYVSVTIVNDDFPPAGSRGTGGSTAAVPGVPGLPAGLAI